MIGNRNASAWGLACNLFVRDGPTIESALSEAERDALALLAELKAIKQSKFDARFVLCPYCQLHRGSVVQGDAGLVCNCPDCGPVPIYKPDTRAWMLDTDWLIRKLRGALDVPPQQSPVPITRDIWRIGAHQRHTVIIGRHLDQVLLHPSLQSRANARNANPAWLITPKPLKDVKHDPGGAVWLPLEERFSLYSGNLHFTEPGSTFESGDDGTTAVNGPLSADFHTVHIEASPYGPISLSDAQAAVFKALWHFKGIPQTAEFIMGRTGYKSDKPADLFKVKARNKGDPKYEGQHYAYQTLVTSDQRAGTYALPCAASTTG